MDFLAPLARLLPLALLGFWALAMSACGGSSGGEGNPSQADPPRTSSAPDLAVAGASASPTSLGPGDSFTLAATVRNLGSGAAATATLRWYRSSDASISPSDTEVGMAPVAALAPGGASDESIVLATPANPGAYHYGACVDSVAGESSAANNCSGAVAVAVAVLEPSDLVVQSVMASPSDALNPRDSFTLNATVRNLGMGPSAATTLRWYFSSNQMISGAVDFPVGTDPVMALAPGGASDESVALSVAGRPGTHYYGACVDSVAGESNAANNCSGGAAVTVIGPSDLVVQSALASPTSLGPGDSFTLAATVRNLGIGPSAATTLRWYRSSDASVSPSDTEVGAGPVAALAPNGASDESIVLSAPASPGTHHYGACVDSVAGESSAANNCSGAVAVAVIELPDLTVLDVSVAFLPVVGAGTTLSATVRNLGDAQAAATTLRWHRFRADGSHPARVDEIGAGPVAALAPGTASSESIGLVPASSGIHHYFACVDSVTGESNTANDCSYSDRLGVSFTTGGPPDLLVTNVEASTPVVGENFTFSAEVINLGGVQAVATTLHWHFSDDAAVAAGDTELGTDPVDPLTTFDSSDESIELMSPASPGIHHYGACVDSVAGESSTANNCGAAAVFTPSGPQDLVVALKASSPDIS